MLWQYDIEDFILFSFGVYLWATVFLSQLFKSRSNHTTSRYGSELECMRSRYRGPTGLCYFCVRVRTSCSPPLNLEPFTRSQCWKLTRLDDWNSSIGGSHKRGQNDDSRQAIRENWRLLKSLSTQASENIRHTIRGLGKILMVDLLSGAGRPWSR